MHSQRFPSTSEEGVNPGKGKNKLTNLPTFHSFHVCDFNFMLARCDE
jgi:hypothetical protein